MDTSEEWAHRLLFFKLRPVDFDFIFKIVLTKQMVNRGPHQSKFLSFSLFKLQSYCRSFRHTYAKNYEAFVSVHLPFFRKGFLQIAGNHLLGNGVFKREDQNKKRLFLLILILYM